MNYKKKLNSFLSLLIAAACLLSFAACSSNSDIPAGMKPLSNENVDYNLYVPQDWVINSQTGFMCAYFSENDNSNISMEAFEIEDMNMSIDDFWASYENDFASTFSDMEYVKRETTLLDGLAANKYVYTATVTGIEYQFMQLVCIRAGIVYIFTYTADVSVYESHIAEVDYIIEQFNFK